MAEQLRAGPVGLPDRIHSLDILRGFAVLGILLMNIQDFSMIAAAYFNPTAYGDLNGANGLVWQLSHIFADQKFMGLFSLMFGAGIVLFTRRAEAKGRGSAGVHYRRMLWLIIFGMLHGYLLWRGDILYAYGMCALLVYLFRRRSARLLLILGLVFLAIGSGISVMAGLSMPHWPPEEVAEFNEDWAPGPETVEREIAAYTGGFRDQMTDRFESTLAMQTFIFLFFFLWRAGGLMLVGMALFKWGLLSAERTNRFYAIMLVVGFGIGIPLIGRGIAQHAARGWSLEYSFFLGAQHNYWGSLFMAAAYIGCIMLAIRLIRKHGIWTPFAATGRMAFTNYIMQTVLCTWIFYGHGLGLFGSVERTGQLAIVFGVWIVQLVLSPLWLARFRFGPLEWLWRSLTYWKLQPMKRG